jgi:hypothetical protein
MVELQFGAFTCVIAVQDFWCRNHHVMLPSLHMHLNQGTPFTSMERAKLSHYDGFVRLASHGVIGDPWPDALIYT